MIVRMQVVLHSHLKRVWNLMHVVCFITQFKGCLQLSTARMLNASVREHKSLSPLTVRHHELCYFNVVIFLERTVWPVSYRFMITVSIQVYSGIWHIRDNLNVPREVWLRLSLSSWVLELDPNLFHLKIPEKHHVLTGIE